MTLCTARYPTIWITSTFFVRDIAVMQRLDKLEEGVAAIGLISSDLGRSMASAEVLDLSFVGRYTGESFCAAEFDAADVFGFSLRLVERVS